MRISDWSSDGALPICPAREGRAGRSGARRPTHPLRDNAPMNDPIPTIRLRNAWRGSHPWIFQKLVDKPAQRPKPGSVVDVVGVDGTWIGRGDRKSTRLNSSH